MGWPLRHLGATLHHAHEQAGTAFLLRDWALMLLAMMPPLVAAPLMHIAVSSLPHRSSRAIAVFASGYATVWLAAGPVLFMMSALLQSLTGGAAFAAAMLIAIVWAISPWQQLALNRCCRLRRIGLFGLDADRDCVTFGLLHEERVRSWHELGTVLARAAPIFLLMAFVVMLLTLALGYVRFEPRWTPLFWVWAPINLFFTCLSEEAFFRGFVQRELARLGANRARAALIALLVASSLFGMAHLAGGWKYALAATLAGIGYGYAYQRTRSLEASMAVHFALNATHFLLFTYPALA